VIERSNLDYPRERLRTVLEASSAPTNFRGVMARHASEAMRADSRRRTADGQATGATHAASDEPKSGEGGTDSGGRESDAEDRYALAGPDYGPFYMVSVPQEPPVEDRLPCCCCADQILVDTEKINGEGGKYGWKIKVTLLLEASHPDPEKAKSACPCRFEWWEFAETAYSGNPGSEWYEMNTRHNSGAKHQAPGSAPDKVGKKVMFSTAGSWADRYGNKKGSSLDRVGRALS
jgi:hypothetical protein